MKSQELVKRFKQYSQLQKSALSLTDRERLKKQILNNLHRTIMADSPTVSKFAWTFHFTRMSIAAMCMLILLTGTTYASFSALPGDKLYSLKRTVEDAQETLTLKPETKAKLQIKFAEKRFQELEVLEMRNSPIPAKVSALQDQLPTPSVVTVTQTPTPEDNEAPKETSKESSAKKEISKAIKNLEKTKTKLEERGKSREVTDLDKTIKALMDRAERHERRTSKERLEKLEPKEDQKINLRVELKDSENSEELR